MNSLLHIRLKNCLQTILDMEPDMVGLPTHSDFRPDMDAIKSYLGRVENMDLAEEDVQRLEQATTSFLAELRELMEQARPQDVRRRVLQ